MPPKINAAIKSIEKHFEAMTVEEKGKFSIKKT